MEIPPILLVLGFAAIYVSAAPPNRQAAVEQNHQQASEHHDTASPHTPNEQQQNEEQKPLYQFAYSKYLEHVIKILESDPKFTERIKSMDENDIKTGKIADHIDDLNPEIFEQLTKAKLAELERLREQIDQDIKRTGDPSKIVVPEHIDVYNWEKFHKEDLRKLIVKTVSHMEEIDKQRKEQFKSYEMQKKAEEDHRLAQLTPEERASEHNKLDESKKRHNEHEKVKHPGGREQLEEVWEESDHMDKDSFNPKTFFALHDLNGDGFWNDEELEALFQIELAKIYNETDPDDDPKERIEEMYRMREHVVAQMDKNKDRLISLEEFLQDNEAVADNKVDEGWQDLGDQKIYTDEELKRFEEEYAQKQGWGEHAYEPVTHPSQNLDQHPPNVPQAQQVVPQHVQNSNSINDHPQQPPPPPINQHQAVDPVYGV